MATPDPPPERAHPCANCGRVWYAADVGPQLSGDPHAAALRCPECGEPLLDGPAVEWLSERKT